MKNITAIVAMFALASAIPHEPRPTDNQFGSRTEYIQNSEEPVYLFNVQTKEWEIPQCSTDTECEEKYTIDPWTCVTWCVEL